MQRPSTVVTAGALLVAAGVAFLATSVYLFAVLTAAGFEAEMFDDPVSLMPWAAAHSRLYQGLWVLYFLTQAAVLLVPSLLGEHMNHRATAVLGTTAVILAMVGVVVFFAAGPVVAEAYVDGEAPPPSVLALHDVAADIAKDLRLFSELLLGVWLVVVGVQLRRASGRVAWWLLSAVGAWTFVVAAWKLADPLIPHEDWLGFLLGLGYLVFGVALVVSGRRGTRDRRRIGDTTVP